jgi:hypothetical protein
MKKSSNSEMVVVTPPDMRVLEVGIRSTAALVSNRFGARATSEIRKKHEAGEKANEKKKLKEARDFTGEFNEARHVSADGWDGIPATSFKNAMVRAASLNGLVMKLTKLSVFVVQDGFAPDGTPLIRIEAAPPIMDVRRVRNETGVLDLRARPMYHHWSCVLRVRYDAKFIDQDSVVNLIARAGIQVGVGEGRPDSTKSHSGMGWGTFELVSEEAEKAAAE